MAKKDDLLKVIEKLESRKKYGLIWDEEKTKEQFEKESENALPVLKEVKGKAINTDASKPTNILIEGDNYHALSVLNYTHQGKIDVIYIDPPYNTGNKDFKYNDDFVEKDDAYRHSKWLSFMSKRLRLAKNLLKDEGVIFISIDDNELAQLKLLCDEIFGEFNFINNITVKSSETSGVKMSHVEKKLPKIKEYLLVYGIQAPKVLFNPIKIKKSENIEKFKAYAKYYSKIILNPKDEPEKWKIISIKEYLKKEKIKLSDADELIKFKLDNAERIVYRTNNRSFNGLSFKTKIAKVVSATGLEYIWWEGKQMLFLSDYVEENLCDLWTDISTINLNKEMTGLPSFSNGQKPIQLISRVLQLFPSKQAVVLDFFAGSGTTANAVMQLNQSDKGNRRAIVCTNNEEGICVEVLYPRIKNVIKGYQNTKGLGGNLKYYKTAFVKNSISRDDLKMRITRECTEMLCLREGIFDEVKAKPDYHIFEQNGRIMGVYYSMERDSLAQLKKELDKMEGEKILYCFTFDPLGLDKNDFADWQGVSLEPIPQKILDIYEQIYEY
jgi:adenine-specific DNA-methyltransferase